MKQIIQAFIKAKKSFAPALKTSTNPHFRNKYADLAACLDAVDDAFLENGIVIYQETIDSPDGILIETVMLHESGESLRCGKLFVPAAKKDPQGFGAALTYARRYSLMTACGIAAEDDDGNQARVSLEKERKKERQSSVVDYIFQYIPELKSKSFKECATQNLHDILAHYRAEAKNFELPPELKKELNLIYENVPKKL